MRTNQKFPWFSFLKSLCAIAIPVALQNTLTTTASMVDTMMVAPLGEVSVAALGLCSQFSSLFCSCYWGLVGGGILFYSQFWGAKDDDGVDHAYGFFTTAIMTVAAVFFCLCEFAPGFVMKVYTDKESIQAVGVQYLKIVGFAYLMQGFSISMSTLLRCTERVRIPMMASVFSVATNIFLNWVLIYGKLGAPALGIRGAALATAIAGFVNVVSVLIMAKAVGYRYLFRANNHFKWGRTDIATYLKKCFPIICNEVLIGVGNMLVSVTLGRQPEQVIAALAVFRTIEGLIIAFFSGFSNASSVLVGKCVGAGELDTAYERAKRLVYLCSGFIAVAAGLIICFRRPILTSFGLSGTSYDAGVHFLFIYLGVSVIRMGNWIQNDTYRAAGDAITGTVLEIAFMYGMLLPLVLLSGFVWNLPYWAIFIFAYCDEPIRYILMQIHLYSGKWIHPVTEKGLEALPAFRLKRAAKHS